MPSRLTCCPTTLLYRYLLARTYCVSARHYPITQLTFLAYLQPTMAPNASDRSKKRIAVGAEVAELPAKRQPQPTRRLLESQLPVVLPSLPATQQQPSQRGSTSVDALLLMKGTRFGMILCCIGRRVRACKALRGCQGASYARSREGYRWTIHSSQQKAHRYLRWNCRKIHAQFFPSIYLMESPCVTVWTSSLEWHHFIATRFSSTRFLEAHTTDRLDLRHS